MPNREQIERLTNRIYKDSKESGSNQSRSEIRKELVKRAKRIEHNKSS
jgi:hypothetical protein